MDNEQIIAYVHHTMSSAEKAAFEVRLRDDAALRRAVANERSTMRRVAGLVSAEINSAAPPSRMSFDAIAHKVAQRRPRTRWHENFATSLVAAAALIVIVFAVIYSLPDTQDVEVAPVINGPVEAPAVWSQTPAVTNTAATLTVPILPTLTTTATLSFEQHPTIPTRVPTIESSNSGSP